MCEKPIKKTCGRTSGGTPRRTPKRYPKETFRTGETSGVTHTDPRGTPRTTLMPTRIILEELPQELQCQPGEPPEELLMQRPEKLSGKFLQELTEQLSEVEFSEEILVELLEVVLGELSKELLVEFLQTL